MSAPFKIQRLLKAPRQLVWEVLTDPKHLANWFGPKGCRSTHSELDFREGGSYHYCIVTADGTEMWGLQSFREIRAPERIVLVQQFSDAKRGVTTHPMAPAWPRFTLSTTTLTEQGAQTLYALEWAAHEATAEEQALFDASHAGMTGGWSGSMDQLEDYLSLLQTT